MRLNKGYLKERTQAFTAALDARGRAHNSGIDLLRLVSMAFVVALHMMNSGWISKLNTGSHVTAAYATCFLIQSFTFCAVDIFALISGYVAYSDVCKPVHIAGYLRLWFQVVAYGLFVSIVVLIVRPELFSVPDFVASFIPITWDTYWYFTAYTGLFLLTPLLNAALRHTPERTLLGVFTAIFLLFSVYNTFFDRFELQDGYSVIWLVVLYCMGGALKKCAIGERMKPWTALALAAALSVLGWLWILFGPTYVKHGFSLNCMTFQFYTSPTVLGAAIFYVIAFSKFRFGTRMTRFIAYASPCAFAVYLLNTHPLSYKQLMQNRFAYLGASSPAVIVGTTLAVSVGFVAASVLIDRIRMRIFELLHIRQLTANIERVLRRTADRFLLSK